MVTRQKYATYVAFHNTLHYRQKLLTKIAFFSLKCLEAYMISFINIILMSRIINRAVVKKRHDNLLFSILYVKYELQNTILYFSISVSPS